MFLHKFAPCDASVLWYLLADHCCWNRSNRRWVTSDVSVHSGEPCSKRTKPIGCKCTPNDWNEARFLRKPISIKRTSCYAVPSLPTFDPPISLLINDGFGNFDMLWIGDATLRCPSQCSKSWQCSAFVLCSIQFGRRKKSYYAKSTLVTSSCDLEISIKNWFQW